MAKLTVRIMEGQERGRQWSAYFHVVGAPVRLRSLQWKAPELTGKELEVEESVGEYTTAGELRLSRLIHRNNIRDDEY